MRHRTIILGIMSFNKHIGTESVIYPKKGGWTYMLDTMMYLRIYSIAVNMPS